MLEVRRHAGGVVADRTAGGAQQFLMAGGISENCVLDSVELYDPVSDRWTMLDARLPNSFRCNGALIADASAALVVRSDSFVHKDSLLLDVRCETNAWQRVALPPVPLAWPALVAIGDHSVLMLGGFSSSETTELTQLFDVRADRWSDRPEWQLPTESHNFHAVVL